MQTKLTSLLLSLNLAIGALAGVVKPREAADIVPLCIFVFTPAGIETVPQLQTTWTEQECYEEAAAGMRFSSKCRISYLTTIIVVKNRLAASFDLLVGGVQVRTFCSLHITFV